MGAKRIIVNWRGVWVEDEGFKVGDDCRGWVCHTDPAVCMGLIDGWKINVKHTHYSTPNRAVLACWGSTLDDSGYMQAFGGTVAQAVARCVIAMRLGDEFECPDELGVMS